MRKNRECKKCGRCCYYKIIVDGVVVYTPYPCEYLDVETRLCTIYDRRHEIHPLCATAEDGIKREIFPGDCPLVADIPGYRPPRMKLTMRELHEIGRLEGPFSGKGRISGKLKK